MLLLLNQPMPQHLNLPTKNLSQHMKSLNKALEPAYAPPTPSYPSYHAPHVFSVFNTNYKHPEVSYEAVPEPAYKEPEPYKAPEPAYKEPEPYKAPEPAYHEPEYK